MATYGKQVLSGSTDGKGIAVAATAIASGTTIHTASTGIDVVTIWAMNSYTGALALTLGWGGTTADADLIIVTIPNNSGLTLVVADLPIKNSLIVKAATTQASKIQLFGSVNRIS